MTDRDRPAANLTPGPSPHGGEGSLIPIYVYELCRQLRARQTPAERVLWEALRDRRLRGFKFRRQHPLGRYIADFYCARARIVVELDGASHRSYDQQAYDRIRTSELQSRHVKVVRLTNSDVEERLEESLQRIAVELPLSTAVERGKGGEV